MDFVKVVTAKKIKKQSVLFKQDVQEKIIFPTLLYKEVQPFVVVF